MEALRGHNDTLAAGVSQYVSGLCRRSTERTNDLHGPANKTASLGAGPAASRTVTV